MYIASTPDVFGPKILYSSYFSDEKEIESTVNAEDDSSSASEDTEGPEEGFDNDEDTVSKVIY